MACAPLVSFNEALGRTGSGWIAFVALVTGAVHSFQMPDHEEPRTAFSAQLQAHASPWRIDYAPVSQLAVWRGAEVGSRATAPSIKGSSASTTPAGCDDAAGWRPGNAGRPAQTICSPFSRRAVLNLSIRRYTPELE